MKAFAVLHWNLHGMWHFTTPGHELRHTTENMWCQWEQCWFTERETLYCSCGKVFWHSEGIKVKDLIEIKDKNDAR